MHTVRVNDMLLYIGILTVTHVEVELTLQIKIIVVEVKQKYADTPH